MIMIERHCMTYRTRSIVLSLVGVLGMLGGCAESDHRAADSARTASASLRREECLVCKHNADLACVDIEVDEQTPTYEYQGRSYYFCSKGCRSKFAQSPAKYLSH